MEPKKLSGFLRKWMMFTHSQEIIQKEIQNAVLKKTGILITVERIIVNNRTVTIEENPAIKSVVFMHKQQILEDLKKSLNTRAPIDIR